MADSTVRFARPEDVPAILQLVKDLASHVNSAHEVVATEELLSQALFAESPSVFAHVVEHQSDDGIVIAGFSLWFLTFSTWSGKYGAWIDDLYVRPEFRGIGYGKALLSELRRLSAERDYRRVEWTVYNWNEPAQRFYESFGAVRKSEFSVYRLDEAFL